ncbi:MAG: hypothetical protein LBP40_08560 [Campylobacteraceae bacterium]|jgi:hypothetical protein|nr:hypothetical protein [Campylobacteraceae bacterium]
MIVSMHNENDAIKLTTLESETILVLARGDNEYKSSSKIRFSRNDDNSVRIRLFNAK